MNEHQRIEIINLCANWLEKVSVGCLIVGLFQPEHIIGGLIGAIGCFILAFTIKIRGSQSG